MARPSLYSPELAALVCTRIANNPIGLRKICEADDMPSVDAILGWLQRHEEFAVLYARAKEIQVELMASDILEISDDGTNDWMERRSEAEKGAGITTGWVINGEHVQRSRLRVDARKWLASKLAPKKYGEKLELAGDKDNPVQHEVAIRPQMTREEWLKTHQK